MSKMKLLKMISVIATVFALSGCGSYTEYTGSEESVEYSTDSQHGETNDYATDSGFENFNQNSMKIESAKYNTSNPQSDTRKEQKHYSVILNIETTDFEKTMEEIESLLKKHNATLINSNESDYSEWYNTNAEKSYSGNMYVRVPYESYDEVLEEMDSINGKIVSKSIAITDNTRQYNGNKDRLSALKNEKKNMERLMEEADTADALVVFYQHLTEINTEIASLETDNNNIVYDTDFAEFNIHVSTVQSFSDTTSINASFGEKFVASFKKGKENFILGFQNLILSMASHWLATLVLFGMIITSIFTIHFFRKKSNSKIITAKTEKELKSKEKQKKETEDNTKEEQ